MREVFKIKSLEKMADFMGFTILWIFMYIHVKDT
jgi:hypothetical protein